MPVTWGSLFKVLHKRGVTTPTNWSDSSALDGFCNPNRAADQRRPTARPPQDGASGPGENIVSSSRGGYHESPGHASGE